MSQDAKPLLLVALGGNAMVRKGQSGTLDEQLDNLRVPVLQIAKLARDHRIIVTHGNGPQVGSLLLQQECCDHVPHMPLEVLVAQSQGQIGYMIESSLDTAFMELGDLQRPIVSLISYVVVDQGDPAFAEPSKPIGPVLNEAQAAAAPYPVRTTAKGLRRVVASPRPLTIVEKREIRELTALDFTVICCGGGGIPVVREGRAFQGVDAVIDKDLASSRLAIEVGVDVFCIATDVPGVALDFGSEKERFLERMSVSQARKHLTEGQFPDGSMGPKVEACLEYLESGGKRAVITATDTISEAVSGRAGTQLVR